MDELGRTHNEVARHLRHARRRALTQSLLRGGLSGAAIAALLLIAIAAAAGPVVAPWMSLAAGTSVLGAFGLAMWWFGRPERAANMRHVAALFDAAEPGLGSRALSALELSAAPTPHASHALISAHAEQVVLNLRALPASQVVAIGPTRERNTWFAAAALLVCAVLAMSAGRVNRGLFALTHPAPLDATGARVGHVVERVTFSLRFPSYLQRTPESLVDATEINVPRGTAVEISIETRLDASSAELHVAGLKAALRSDGERRFSGRFVARDSGALRIALEHRGQWLSDQTPRRLTTQIDSAPVIDILTPIDHSVVAPDGVFELSFRANDDMGLGTIDLLIRAPSGGDQRRRLWSAEPSQSAQTTQAQQLTLFASELMAKPGDIVELWIEATDRSAFDGPNRGRSEIVHIEIASDAGLKQQARQALREILDRMLDVLADRLEHAPDTDDGAARAHINTLHSKSHNFLERLDDWLRSITGTQAVSGADQEAVRASTTRHRRLITEEKNLHGTQLAALAARASIDRRCVEALEGDVIFLSDLMGRTHLAEAEALAQELEQIRQQLTALMKRLESTDDAQAHKDMLAAIERAKQRLSRLMQSISALAENVPSEFVNADALRASAADDALSSMQNALEQNDLRRAEQELDELSQGVEELQAALRNGTLSFTNERFGERNRALESARSELSALAEEQARLAQRSGDVLKRVGERIAQRDDARNLSPALQAKAKAARDALDSIDRSSLGSAETQALDRVSQRLSDTGDAMSNGDLLEAERMASMAAQGAHELERDLDIMRRMFPGSRGETARNAERAQRASNAIDGLQGALAQRVPDVSSAMNGTDRSELQRNAEPQQSLKQGADRLASALEQGPEGAPLHQGAAQSLRNAERAMQRAEQALREADPQAAANSQAEARDALERARESMQEQQGGQGRGRGGREGDDGRTGGHVQIPDNGSRASDELRRKLIEGMRDARPSGYESAVERYYRELLE